jgi:plasmid maintenance system antidote protein VapI
LRKAIVDSGLSQYRIAKESGVPQPVLNRFVNGERDITVGTAGRLCSYLKLELRRRR